MSSSETLQWWALTLARPYLKNQYVDKGKAFLLDNLNPKPGDSLGRLGTKVVQTRYGFRIAVDMSYTSHRALYLSGEYEMSISRLLASILSREWQCIDVGANIGFYSLLAGALSERVWSFEPNEQTRRLLGANIALNSLGNITVFPYGLSDESADLSINQTGNDIGGASFRPLEAASLHGSTVPVVRGDSVIAPDSNSRILIKVDVEGWEHKALRGLAGILTAHECAVVCEVTDDWLIQTGSSAADLFEFMSGMGFHAYEIYSPPTRLVTNTRLKALRSPLARFQYDVLFTRQPSEQSFYSWATGSAVVS